MTSEPRQFPSAAAGHSEPVLDYSTSAAGSVSVELLDAEGKPLPGFTAAECDAVVGDQIELRVTWKKRGDLSALAGRPIRVRFAMKDADLYSIRFAR